VNPRDATALGHLALYYAKKGDYSQAKDFVRRARAIDSSNVYLIYIAAILNTASGNSQAAVSDLRLALQEGFALADIQSEPEFSPFAGRSDFQNLLKEFSRAVR